MRLTLAVVLMCGAAWAQDEKKEKEEEKVVQASDTQSEPQGEIKKTIYAPSPLKGGDPFNAPYSVPLVGERDIQERMPRTAGTTLLQVPGAHAQQTGPGQGTPFLRGLDPYRSLVLIDGIRMNHSVMRSGPNQYYGTIDPFLIAQQEIMMGPASVLYGSDSLGGTIYIHTREPFTFEEGTHLHGRTFGRYASAENAYTGRQEFAGNIDDFGWSVGGTWVDVGDIIGGNHVGRMEGTEYDEYSADMKFGLRLDEESKVILGVQHHKIRNRPRWHSTFHNDDAWQGLDTGNNLRRDQDQQRNLVYLQYLWESRNGGDLIDALQVSLSWHRHEESKVRHRSAADGRKKTEEFELDSPGAWIRAGKETCVGYVTVGAEFYHEIVDSSSRAFDPTPTAPQTASQSFGRGIIAGDATYQTVGVFIQDEFSIGPLDIVPGVRFTYIMMDADDVDPAVVDDNPLTLDDPAIPNSMDDTYQAVTGSLRLLYHLDEHWNLIAGWGMGFRAPTLHDSTAIDFVLSGGSLQVPSSDLDPEIVHTFDGGVRARYDRWEFAAFAFWSELKDFIGKQNVGDVDGDLVDDFRAENFSDGWIYGYEVMALYRFTQEVSAFFSWGYAKGRRDYAAPFNHEGPLAKVGPSRAHLGVRFEPENSGAWVEVVSTFADEQHHLDPDTEAGGDDERQPRNGTPGYAIVTIRGGYAVNENVEFTAAVENVTNKDYRIHGSGQNETGTNVIVGVDVQF